MQRNRTSLETYLTIIAVVWGTVITHSPATSLPAPVYTGPASQPSFPVDFSAFNPPVTNLQPVAGTPEIAEWTRDNKAGDTVIMTGEGFSSAVQSDVTTVDGIMFNHNTTRDSLRHMINWSDTVIEITCSAFQTPNNDAWIFRSYTSGYAENVGIRYSNGKWYAYNGASTSYELGDYDSAEHTFRYDMQNGTVSLDGHTVSVGPVSSHAQNMYIGCSSGGYQYYPLKVSNYKIWQGGTKTIDAMPLIGGTFSNTVDGSIIYNTRMAKGVVIPFTVSAERDIEYSANLPLQFVAYGSGTTGGCDIVRLADGNKAAVRLPKGLPGNGMYLLWPGNLEGYGAPVAINQTEAWWVGPDLIEPGVPFSVYGRNFGTQCWVYIEELNQWLESESCNPYKADFTMPAGIAPGDYTLWAHNGFGRAYGWSQPLSASVVSPYTYNGRIIDVSNYGAMGDGITDDWGPISSALAAASPGDTIYFPAGTYAISFKVYGKNGLRMVGDGIDQTIIKPHTSTSTDGIMFDGIFNGMIVSNMTFETIDSVSHELFRWQGNRNLFDTVKFSSIHRPISTAYINAPFNFINNKHITFNNCAFINASVPGDLNIGGGQQVFLQNCDFYGAKLCTILIAAWGVEETSIQNCTAQPYDDTVDGQFDGRWLVTADYWGAVNRIYFGGNTSSNLAPPHGVGYYHVNTGEQILIEGGNFKTRGSVVSATADTLQISTVANIPDGKHIVTIVDGRGYGQTRKVSLVNANTATLTLNEPWRVIPDSSSTFVVTLGTYRFVAYDNRLDGKSGWVETTAHAASTGVESYGGSVDLVVDGNTFKDLKYGIVHWPLEGLPVNDETSLQECFFNTFKNNIITNCYGGITTRAGGFGHSDYLDGGILAATYRENRLDGITSVGVNYNVRTNAYIVDMSVFERNVFNNCRQYAVKDDLYLKDQLFLDNTGTNSNEGTAMSFSYDHIPALKNNKFVGYSVDIQHGPSSQRVPDKLLNLPRGLVELGEVAVSAGLFKVPIWNLGASNMVWTANCTNSWIALEESTGNVEGQGEGEILFQIDPQLRPANETTATITLSSGSQTQQVTVVYASDSGSSVGDGDVTMFPRANAGAEHRIEIFDQDSTNPRIYSVAADANEFVITSGMTQGDWSRIRILEREGTNWNVIHEEWTADSKAVTSGTNQ